MGNDLTQKTKPDCPFYDQGGNSKFNWPSAPSAYGARCNFHNKFFSKREEVLSPNCFECPGYEPAIELVSLVYKEAAKKLECFAKELKKKNND
jgi:hypothetical protein